MEKGALLKYLQGGGDREKKTEEELRQKEKKRVE